jgi:hypothetical protein
MPANRKSQIANRKSINDNWNGIFGWGVDLQTRFIASCNE